VKISRGDYVKELQLYFPWLRDSLPYPTNMAIPDRGYWLPTEREWWKDSLGQFIDQYEFIKELFDCDDFSLVYHAWVVQVMYKQAKKRELPPEEWFPWAVGQAWGSRFRGKDTGHAIIFCLTRDKGLLLYEPQISEEFWRVKKYEDLEHFKEDPAPSIFVYHTINVPDRMHWVRS